MADATCSHCGQLLPSGDVATCPFCREPIKTPVATPLSPSRTSERIGVALGLGIVVASYALALMLHSQLLAVVFIVGLFGLLLVLRTDSGVIIWKRLVARFRQFLGR